MYLKDKAKEKGSERGVQCYVPQSFDQLLVKLKIHILDFPQIKFMPDVANYSAVRNITVQLAKLKTNQRNRQSIRMTVHDLILFTKQISVSNAFATFR